jgi:hypothetical protein
MNTQFRIDSFGLLLAGAMLLGAGPAGADSRVIDLHQSADPRGQVEIDSVSGHVEVVGWERAEIAVSGTLGERVERVDLSADGDHATVHVVLRTRGLFHGGDESSAELVVHVPRDSLVRTSLVSADLVTHDLRGEQRLRTVSGDIHAELARGGSVNSVSGEVKIGTSAAADPAAALEVETISGDVRLEGSVGDLRLQTVSGGAHIKLGTLTAARLKTISGDLEFAGSLSPTGHFEAESVSGTLTIDFATTPAADFDVESHTGSIENCFGPAPQTSHYGPGSHLVFRNGDGSGRVRISSLSGSIRLCNHL